MINKVALLRLEDIYSSGIAFDSKLLFCKKPQALQEAADQKNSIRSLCRSMKPLKHKKFMQINEATEHWKKRNCIMKLPLKEKEVISNSMVLARFRILSCWWHITGTCLCWVFLYVTLAERDLYARIEPCQLLYLLLLALFL